MEKENGTNLNNTIGVLVWARNYPKEEVFLTMIDYVSKTLKKSIIFFIDDLCPKQVYARSDEEQGLYNVQYESFFQSNNVPYYFSSELIKPDEVTLNSIKDLLNGISIKEYASYLPQKKVKNNELEIKEIIHTAFQEVLLRKVLLIVPTILLGKFSQNLVMLHKKLTGESVETIIIDRIT
ncbi:TPA: hypothetical protein ACGO2J_002198 [Streptococcus suis]